MTASRGLLVMRAVSTAVVIVAIVVAAVTLSGEGRFAPTRFFAFFTIQSNLIGVAAYLWLLANGNRPRTRGLELLRGAAAVYLTVTFVVVIVLLSDADVQLDLMWVDVVLHKLFPIVVVLDWLIDPPQVPLRLRDGLVWLVYPIAWAVVTMVRGAVDGWYPYPFLDPANGGYATVAVTIGAITIAFLGLSVAFIALGNWRGRGHRQPSIV
jgi:hypothetical protein